MSTKNGFAQGSNGASSRRHSIRRLSLGNFGAVEPVGEGVSELKIDYGPGYRVYFVQHGNQYVLLLVGGDKSTQVRDIRKAKALARAYAE